MPAPTLPSDERDAARWVAVVVGVLIFLMAARTPLDSDLWWHLRTGEETLQSGKPVLTDIFSFTRYGSPWINHSWLGQVVLAGLYRLGGYTALTVLVAGLATLSLMLVYRQMSAPPLWRAVVVILAGLVCAPLWTARPQLFSLALFALLLVLLPAFRTERLSPYLVLPPLFAVWSNLHGGYALGFLLLGATLAGQVMDRWLTPEHAPSWRGIARLAGASALGFLAVALNPNGINMWKIPFQTVGVQILRQAISEWASPDFHDLTQQPFLWMLAGILLTLGISRQRRPAETLLPVLLFTAMGLMARRNFAPFALAAAPLLASAGWEALQTAFAPLSPHLKRYSGASRPVRASLRRSINLTSVGLLAFAAFLKAGLVSHPALVEGAIRQYYPADAVAWMEQHHPTGNLFNEYAWGGYLIWRLPQVPVFVDGRTDLYGDDLLKEWLTLVNAGEDWQNLLEKHGIRLALISPDAPLRHALKQAGWQEQYADPIAVILAKP
ncbi:MULTISPECIES: hypothetical protein [Anaerolinea]|uniref:hypothetical protein n=1 Tax=Anaerolinea TaxID=233189 RepID=UPI00261F4D64|nr:hypothetical protein [Anaerolinea thermophila]